MVSKIFSCENMGNSIVWKKLKNTSTESRIKKRS